MVKVAETATRARINPSPPGLTLECLGGLSRPRAISRTVGRRESCEAAFKISLQDAPESREPKIEVTCEVKVRSKVKIRRFDVLVTGNQNYRT